MAASEDALGQTGRILGRGPRLATGQDVRTRRLVQGLGLFSLGLGAAQVAAPGLVNRLAGLQDDSVSRRWQRVVGIQELTAAAGILPQARPVAWLWARSSADVLHLAMLGRALGTRRSSGARMALAIGSVAGCLAADSFAGTRLSAERNDSQQGGLMQGHAAITIDAPLEDVAARWRSFEREGGELVRLGPLQVEGEDPRGGVEWTTTAEADASAQGSAVFADAPGGRGTEIHLSVGYDPPAGRVGAAVMKVTGDEPLQRARDDLRRLKQLIEAGEIARSEGSPAGSSAAAQPKQRPAQPLAHNHS